MTSSKNKYDKNHLNHVLGPKFYITTVSNHGRIRRDHFLYVHVLTNVMEALRVLKSHGLIGLKS